MTLKRGEHSKYLPSAFTENGIAMLSGVLNSARAVNVNIQIMRAFTRLRVLYEEQKAIFNQLNKHKVKLLRHDRQFGGIFRALDDMQAAPEMPKKKKIALSPRSKTAASNLFNILGPLSPVSPGFP